MAICPQSSPTPAYASVLCSFIPCAVRVFYSLSLSVSAFLTLSSLLCVSQLSPQSTWSILIIASLNYPAPPHSPPLAPPLITPGGVTQAEWSVQINWAEHVMPYNRNLSHWSLHALSSARLSVLPGQRQRPRGGKERGGEGCLGSTETWSLHNTFPPHLLLLFFFCSMRQCGKSFPRRRRARVAPSEFSAIKTRRSLNLTLRSAPKQTKQKKKKT